MAEISHFFNAIDKTGLFSSVTPSLLFLRSQGKL
jgi:hypothetical protein